MRNSRLTVLACVALSLLSASTVAALDRSVENFLSDCSEVRTRLDGSFAPSLSYDSWKVTIGDDAGSSDRRPEKAKAGRYPRALVEKLETDKLEAKGLLAKERSSGNLWSAWIGVQGDGCLVLEGTANEMQGDGATLKTSADGRERVLEAGDLRLVFELSDDEMAADPDDIADCHACEESKNCQSNNCAGPEGGRLCRPASGMACPPIADCLACKESDDCLSNDCAGPAGGKLCLPASGAACPTS